MWPLFSISSDCENPMSNKSCNCCRNKILAQYIKIDTADTITFITQTILAFIMATHLKPEERSSGEKI